jgi:hypothetical protein
MLNTTGYSATSTARDDENYGWSKWHRERKRDKEREIIGSFSIA